MFRVVNTASIPFGWLKRGLKSGGLQNSPTFSFSPSSGIPVGFTFDRASAATYFDSAGVMKTAASGVARFDFDPATLSPRGLLIEESRTNLCYPSLPDASWLSSGNSLNVSLGSNATAIDGTDTAALLLDNATNSAHYLRNNNVTYVVSGTTYTLSIFAKASTQSAIQLFPNGGYFDYGHANFNLAAGTIGNYAVVTPVIQNCGNGWYRCSITMPAKATGPCASLGLCLINSQPAAARLVSYEGTGTGVYVWGEQDEVGAFPTSYIPTTTAAATRADESLYTTTIPWFNATQGTMVAQYITIVGVNILNRVATFSDGTFNNQICLLRSVVNNTELNIRVDGSGNANSISGGALRGVINKSGARWTSTTQQSATNGNIGTQQSVSTGLPTVTGLYLGRRGDGAERLNGWLQSFKYWNRALSSTELQRLTA